MRESRVEKNARLSDGECARLTLLRVITASPVTASVPKIDLDE